MNSRLIIGRIARELIPAPTLGRLAYLKRAITGPRKKVIGDLGHLSQRVLSPALHLRLRRVAVSLLGHARVPAGTAVLGSLDLSEKKNRNPRKKFLTGPFYFRGVEYETLAALHAEHGRIEVDVAIASAFLGRHEVLELMATEATSLPEGYRTLVCLVGSSSEDGSFLTNLTARNPSVLGMLAKNKPVGRKWQSNVDLIRAVCDYQLLGITGSDDILPAGMITRMVESHKHCCAHDSIRHYATSLYGTMEWLIFSDNSKDTLAPQIVKCNYKMDTALMPLGAGRFYSRQVIDRLDGDIFDVRRDRLLDDKGFYKVHNAGLGIEYYDVNQGVVLSIKGDWSQMNSFEAIIGASNVKTSEFSFEGFGLLKEQLSPDTFERLFGDSERVNTEPSG